MERIKVSKDLLRGVELCSKQLDIIKTQLDTFLFDKDHDSNSDRFQRKRKGDIKDETKTHIKKSVNRSENNNYDDVVDLESSSSSPSNNSKDKEYVGPGGRKAQKLFEKRFATDVEDKAYKPGYYHKKQSTRSNTEVNGSQKKRGRPLKMVKNTSGLKRGRPKKILVDAEVSDSEPTKDEKHNDSKKSNSITPSDSSINVDELNTSSKNTRGKRSLPDDNSEEKDEKLTITKRVHGRLSKSESANENQNGDENLSSDIKTTGDNANNQSRKRGRPKKIIKSKKAATEKSDDSNLNKDCLVSSTPKGRLRSPRFSLNASMTEIE